MEALHADDTAAVPKLRPRSVDFHTPPCEPTRFSILERVAYTQSAASFAVQHRVLPDTDMTGLRLWPCTLRLIERLVGGGGGIPSLPRIASDIGRPLRCLECGAGTGLLGLAVSNALGSSASLMLLTDPGVPIGGGWTSLEVLQRTVEANAAASPSAAAAKLRWGDADDIDALRHAHGTFDVAIGSELLYREDSVATLAQTMLALEVPMVVLAQQTRPAGNSALEDAFTGLMVQAGYRACQSSAGAPCMIHVFRREQT